MKLQFSVDTLSFDTLFTTVGSTTRQVRVYNRSGRNVVLSSVTLRDGRQSRFRLNVDGDTAMVARDIEILDGDSIFIFVQANIDPRNETSPFVVDDAIVFGNGQRLPLTAWGRNAIYHKVPAGASWSTIDCNTWDHTLPHVFLGHGLVPEGKTLTLNAGDELYFASGAMLIVDSTATLKVQGTAEQPVLFSSLRRDGWYRFLPGQWQTIWFYNCSTGNSIDHAIIENGMGAVRCYPGASVTVTNSVIRNMSDAAIVGQSIAIAHGNIVVQTATINGNNLLVYDCLTAITVLGGSYDFTGCTFANYWSYSARKLPNVVLSNYMTIGNTNVGADLLKADFKDCIIYGTYQDGELIAVADGVHALNHNEPHSIVRGGEWSVDPMFNNPKEGDYTLQEGSPAIGLGFNFQDNISFK